MDASDPYPITHGFWFVAFVDLLGQQEAFLRTDYMPEADNAAKRDAFVKEVQASVGVVRGMRHPGLIPGRARVGRRERGLAASRTPSGGGG
jgi:hypothetical protein